MIYMHEPVIHKFIYMESILDNFDLIKNKLSKSSYIDHELMYNFNGIYLSVIN